MGIPYSESAFERVVREGNTEAVKVFLAAGMSPDTGAGHAPVLIYAAGRGHAEVVRILLDRGAKVNAKDRSEQTALMKAAENGHTGIVKMLLDKEADPTVVDPSGYTAITFAAKNNHTAIVRMLKDGKNKKLPTKPIPTRGEPKSTAPSPETSGSNGVPPDTVSKESVDARHALGKWTRWEGLAISVEKYEVTQQCRGRTGGLSKGGPAEGAKLVYIWISVRNESAEVIDVPSFSVHISGMEKDSDGFGGVCRYDDESLGNACYKGRGKLYPGVECGGWKLFEVMERMRVSEQFVTVSVHRWKKTGKVGQWQLGESKSR